MNAGGPPKTLGGLLLVDKPRGPTSHDAVLAVRRLAPRGVKVGHTGTLDPMATGLLILLVGGATKLASQYQRLPKVYTGRVRFGTETDTGDLDGRVVRETPVPPIDAAAVQAAMDSHLGRLELPPPAFSAVKFQGKPLYSYARKGIEVPVKSRPCAVYEWKLLQWSAPEAAFRLSCSHGTYARALAVRLGVALGCAAVLSELRREKIGDYGMSDAVALDAARRMPWTELAARLLPARPLPPEPAT